MSEPTRTKVGPRGRVTVPVALQRAVGLTEGAEVILRALRPGVVIMETPQAIKDRIRAGIPPTAETEYFDAVGDIRTLRDVDATRFDHLGASREFLSQPASGAGPPNPDDLPEENESESRNPRRP
ncbi:AbrB/MazE/SpoVT family DNA-binding domain-containing protein [Streptomyces sp. BJ20]|uniref:AbrB/MazE/SpoVT family DNA-binding domain-containing protein n=1 Tax=Streptomyces sp. BJ20 TaxID=2930049 RepID=UPI001FD5871D|nr:AbrB/MazE/SpoVT family DNA-binding domain-containing protein [Streptomyces sp. BJ20]